MNLNDLVKFIGCSEINFDLVELLASADYSIQNLPQKKSDLKGWRVWTFHLSVYL